MNDGMEQDTSLPKNCLRELTAIGECSYARNNMTERHVALFGSTIFLLVWTDRKELNLSHNEVPLLSNSFRPNLLSSLGHLRVRKATSIQTFDFSTLYTSIPHDLLKSSMNNIINNAFKHKNGAAKYTHLKVGRNKSYFTSDPLNGDNKYTFNDICKMIEFLVDRFGGQLFRQMVGILMGKNCAPLLADLFLYSYEKEFFR